MSDDAVRPIFVVGSARSGTTMLGAWLGSDPRTYDTGELNALDVGYRVLPQVLSGLQPRWYRQHVPGLATAMRETAIEFVLDLARAEGCDSFTDSTPRNLLVAGELAERFPDALFVLTIRHYSGVVQSLGRTDWSWVPDDLEGRAEVWADAYAAVTRLPLERTVAVSYDALCAQPVATLTDLSARLAAAGVRVDALDDSWFGYSHAHVAGHPRPTVRDEGGSLAPIPSADVAAWDLAAEAAVSEIVRPVEAQLQEIIGDHYRAPAGFAPAAAGDRQEAVSPALRALDFVVADLARAEELLVELLGLVRLGAGPHPSTDADVVELGAGDVAVRLLHPTDVGDRPPFGSPQPRLAEITCTVPTRAALEVLRGRLVDAGAAVVHGGHDRFVLRGSELDGTLGTSPSIAVVVEETDGPP